MPWRGSGGYVTAQADDPLATLIGPASGLLTSEDAEALWSRLEGLIG